MTEDATVHIYLAGNNSMGQALMSMCLTLLLHQHRHVYIILLLSCIPF